jgi:hypothetical protein
MPIKITLRTGSAQSPYRRLLEKLLTSPIGDSALLCSGYIWQPGRGNYNVLDDGLRSTILTGCTSGRIITVAGKFHPDRYREYYRNFVSDLRSNRLKVSAFEAPKKNWHAKIAIRLSGRTPVAALIGSSNLTGPAYGEGRKNWNYESDVLIWKSSKNANTYFREDGLNLPFGRFETILAPDVIQLGEEEQLQAIYEDVMNSGLEDFEE